MTFDDPNFCGATGHDALTRQVLEARAEIEASFTKASSDVLGASTTIADLGGLVEPLGTLVENLRTAEDLSVRMGQAMRDEAEHMQTVCDALQNVAQPMDQLGRVIRMVNLVGLNARVAAGGSGSKKHVQFVEDIRNLAVEADAKIKDVRHALDETAASLHDVGQTQQAFRDGYSDRFGSLIALEADQQEFLKNFAKDAEDAAALAADISAKATDGYGELAMSFFAADAVSQRLEHVAAALADLPPGPSSLAELQRRQSVAAIADLDKNLVQIGRAHRNLTRTVDDFKELLSRMIRRQGDADGQLPYLKKCLSHAMAVLVSSQAQRRGLDKQITVVTAKLETLFDRITRLTTLERRLQLVSLNLSINCQSGDGSERTLAAIAAQFMELAAQTKDLIAKLIKALEHVKERAIDFRRSTERDTVGAIAKLGKSTAGPMRSLDAVLGKFELEERLWESVSELDQSGTRLAALKDVSAALNRSLRVLEQPGRCIADPSERAKFDQLKTQYSMQEEREIHDHFMAELFPDYAAMAAPEDAAPKLELF